MYFLNKQEIAHTTNLSFLRGFPRLDKSKRTNYGSEQTMEELVRAIGVTLGEDILYEVCSSAYYGIIIDEATDIAVENLCLIHRYSNFLFLFKKQCTLICT